MFKKLIGLISQTMITAEKETSKSDKDLLRRLHVKDGDKIIEGAEAFL